MCIEDGLQCWVGDNDKLAELPPSANPDQSGLQLDATAFQINGGQKITPGEPADVVDDSALEEPVPEAVLTEASISDYGSNQGYLNRDSLSVEYSDQDS